MLCFVKKMAELIDKHDVFPNFTVLVKHGEKTEEHQTKHYQEKLEFP